MPNEPHDFPVFEQLEKDKLECKIYDILLPLEYFVPNLSIDWNDVRYNEEQITDIVDLVERRRVYFWIYHQIDMGELNEICLICFWILKFNPFYDSKNPNRNVNLVLALYLFLRMVRYIANKRKRIPNITLNIYQHIEHAFIYRDLSKESLMAIAESLIG